MLVCSLEVTSCYCCYSVTSVVSDSVQPHPWDSPGKNTGVGCRFLLQCIKVKSESEVAQLCPTLCDPTDCRLPGSSVLPGTTQMFLDLSACGFESGFFTHSMTPTASQPRLKFPARAHFSYFHSNMIKCFWASLDSLPVPESLSAPSCQVSGHL